MTNLEETLSDEKVKEIEDAQQESRRSKTKWGHLLAEDDSEEDEA